MSETGPDTLLAPGGRPKRRLSIVGAVGWFAVSYVGAILGYLVVNALAARLLVEDFGYFVLALTVSNLLQQMALIGVHRGGLREAARREPGDDAVLVELRRSVRAVSLVAVPSASIGTAAVSFLVLQTDDMRTRAAVAVGMGALVFLGAQQKLWANYLRGFGKVRFASLLEGRSGGALVSLCQAACLAAVLLVRPGWGLPGALAALALGFTAPVLVAWANVHRVWRHVDGRGPVLADLVVAVRRYWRFASNQLGGFLNSTLEIWLAAVVLIDTQVSLFSAAQRLSVLLAVPLSSLGVVFSPMVARLFGRHDDRLEKLLRSGAAFAAVATTPVWLPMLIAPGRLLDLVYGSGFGAAAPILVLLTVGSVVNIMTGLSATALSMSEFQGVFATVQWVCVGLRLVAGAAAVLAFGAVGLGASSALVTAVLYLTLWVQVRRRMGLWTHPTARPSIRLMRDTALTAGRDTRRRGS